MSYYPEPPREEPHKDAARALMSGFAGCLGVGLAIVFVMIMLIVFIAVVNHH